MMRSMYSGVAGLKTHQTKMDVIGNNIANVNTTAYKSSSINFSELMYQTTSKASGPNALTGRAGVNPKQIGLGVQSAAITNKITSAGATQTTGNPFDIKINGDAFFVVSDGVNNYFTRDGSFYVDAAGNLAMSSNGYNIMGWGVDEATQTIKKDTVSALRIMSAANMTYPPEATTESFVEGILDKNEPDASTSSGKSLNLGFYDALGYSYTAKFAIHATDKKGEYTVELTDILNEKGDSVIDIYGVNGIEDIASFGGTTYNDSVELKDLLGSVTYDDTNKVFNKTVGKGEAFEDYDSTKISGVSYTIDGVTADTTYTAGSTVTMKGTGTVTKEDLESVYGLVYVEPTAGTPYYWVDDHVTGTGKKVETEADWASVLHLTSVDTVNMDAAGNVTYELKQDFKVGDTDVVYHPANETFTTQVTPEEAYGVDQTDPSKTYKFDVAPDGQAQITTTTEYKGFLLKFDVDSGAFVSIDGSDNVLLDFNDSATTKAGDNVSLGSFSDINMDWSHVTWYNNGGSSTMTATAGTEEKGLGSGRKQGQMSGVSIENTGKIYASYDNGMNKLLGQIAVAKFANAAGLEKAGDNLYSATQNSGEFDGIGVDITADGTGSMTTGALEMSNVDLSAEFTEMITTQRGFQANSRIITVSDTLLEELVNLKR